jgi:hypothetical protein
MVTTDYQDADRLIVFWRTDPSPSIYTSGVVIDPNNSRVFSAVLAWIALSTMEWLATGKPVHVIGL